MKEFLSKDDEKRYFRKTRSPLLNTYHHCLHFCRKCYKKMTCQIDKQDCQKQDGLYCGRCSGEQLTDKELEEYF